MLQNTCGSDVSSSSSSSNEHTVVRCVRYAFEKQKNEHTFRFENFTQGG
jgi:hypothetical protein